MAVTIARHTWGMTRNPNTLPCVVVVMGVAASGKTVVGSELAAVLDFAFADADHDHPASNRAKMERGEPLDDADRAPWLERLRRRVVRHLTQGPSLVLACSALKAAYRDTLAGGDPRVAFVHLDVPREVLERRLRERSDHFFEPALLDSQLDTLERPVDAVHIDGSVSVEDVVEAARAGLASRGVVPDQDPG